jgi:hypothetical protein
LLVAEVGDELEGAAQDGDVAVKDVLGGDVAAFDLRDPGDGDADAGGDLFLGQAASWVRPRRLRISASRQPLASSSIAVTGGSSANDHVGMTFGYGIAS